MMPDPLCTTNCHKPTPPPAPTEPVHGISTSMLMSYSIELFVSKEMTCSYDSVIYDCSEATPNFMPSVICIWREYLSDSNYSVDELVMNP